MSVALLGSATVSLGEMLLETSLNHGVGLLKKPRRRQEVVDGEIRRGLPLGLIVPPKRAGKLDRVIKPPVVLKLKDRDLNGPEAVEKYVIV